MRRTEFVSFSFIAVFTTLLFIGHPLVARDYHNDAQDGFTLNGNEEVMFKWHTSKCPSDFHASAPFTCSKYLPNHPDYGRWEALRKKNGGPIPY